MAPNADGSPNVYEKGVKGVESNKGVITRPGCTHVVCLQLDEADDALPYMYAKSEVEAKAYVSAMKAQGQGKGLRIVKVADFNAQNVALDKVTG